MRRAAEILRVVLAYEEATHDGTSRTEVAHTLARQNTDLGAEFFGALVALDPNAGAVKVSAPRSSLSFVKGATS